MQVETVYTHTHAQNELKLSRVRYRYFLDINFGQFLITRSQGVGLVCELNLVIYRILLKIR
jgi:hypothetical protein